MSAVAGWYADPSGSPGQLRWWDGATWTEHVTADPNATTHVEVPPPPGAPAGSAGAGTAGGDGTPVWGSGAAAGAGTPVWGSSGASTPVWGSGSGSPGSGSWTAPPVPQRTGARVGLIVAIVVIGLGLVLVGVVFAGLFAIRSGGGEVTVTSDSSSRAGETAATTTTDLAVGGSVAATIPEGGALEAVVTVDHPGIVTFDVRGDDGFDARLEVLDPTGASIADNDDRGDSADGTRALDPLLELDLAPGTYRAVVDGWAGDGGGFELAIR